MAQRAPRFPGIDWYCDKCSAYLNDQEGFDDHKYVWKCRKCGYKNSLSWDNISVGSKLSSCIGIILLFAGIVNVYLLIASILSMAGVAVSIPYKWLTYFKFLQPTLFLHSFWPYAIAFVLLVILGLLFERFVANYHPDKKLWVLRSFIYYFWLWISGPVRELAINTIGFLKTLFLKKQERKTGQLLSSIFFALISLLIVWVFIGLITK